MRVPRSIFFLLGHLESVAIEDADVNCLQRAMDSYCNSLKVDGEEREKCVHADSRLYARYGLNAAGRAFLIFKNL